MAEPTHITVRNARVHNLKGVDLAVPREQLVVFTGVSGSGKSSLAHDTIFQEGQRRFVESLSAYARQFLGEMERPAVDAVEGVSPTLAIDQKTVNRNPRSTVGTVTEIFDHLRLLMARLGTPHCPLCGTEVAKTSTSRIVDRLLEEAAGTRILVLAPVVRARKGEYRKELAEWFAEGWVRARIDGEVVGLEAPPELARYEKHTIELVVDRLRVDQAERARLYEAVGTAARLADGSLTVHWPDAPEGEAPRPDRSFSTERACPDHPEEAIPELEPRLFSFNAPQGACGGCSGLGAIEQFEPDLLLDRDRALPDAFLAFNEEGRVPFARLDRDTLVGVARTLGAPVDRPVREWPGPLVERLLRGDAAVRYEVAVERTDRVETRERAWSGLVPLLDQVWTYTSFPGLARFRSRRPCAACGGERLNPAARAVTFRGKRLPELTGSDVEGAAAYFRTISLRGAEKEIGEQLLVEIRGRLDFLREVGLGYLSLDRSAATLSGGESQRIRLAAQVGSALHGVTYVLDEPSIGLHPRDNLRLLGALRRLRDRGNSVLVVEHDAETILAADWVVDVGPGAGRGGGHVVAAGPPARLLKDPRSPTAAWLRGERRMPEPPRRAPPRRDDAAGWLRIRGARANNLRGLDVDVPLGCLVAVTGVSGSGKSSLVGEVLEPSVRERRAVRCAAIEGLDGVDGLVEISQAPIGRTPRSNPATYTGLFDLIRDLFAQTPESRARGYKKGRFSFNVAGGRCEACEGAGVRAIEMLFLPSVEVPCEVCGGKRFNAETLEIRWKGLTITDVLGLGAEDALAVFEAVPKVARILRTLVEVGLGYLPLGQPSTTLSGGEAQRIKLASELHRPATGRTLYLLDEPTTGLHFADVERLVAALQRLVDGGNSVLVVEHHTDVIRSADWLLDLGPEGGGGGGRLVGWGPPEAVAEQDSPTGRILAALGPLAADVPADVYAPARRRSGARADTSVIAVRGARLHNLQAVDVDIPHGKTTVITGVSGSGKTSLAFDTVFAEGQRQYVESLSTYARRFLGRVERAPVDRLEGLQPAIAIDQRRSSHNPRSTVATVTEVHDVLRLLYARVGQPHCPTCRRAVRVWSPSEAAAELARAAPGPGWLVARLRPAEDPASRRAALHGEGHARLLVGGREVDLDGDAAGALASLAAGADLVLDRFAPERAPLSRGSEGIERGYALGGGRVRFVARTGGERAFTERAECPEHGVVHAGELTPKHFSFNSRLGACARCDGVGRTVALVPERLFPEPDRGFWESIDPRVGSVLARTSRHEAAVNAVLARLGCGPETPVRAWSAALRTALFDGLPGELEVTWSKQWGSSRQVVTERRAWEGLRALLDGWGSRLSWLQAEQECPACGGRRLRPELLAVTLGGRSIGELAALPVDDAWAAVGAWSEGPDALTGARAVVAERPRAELLRRLGFLRDVGLGYLSLDRAAGTLSGGESQRIRLASQLGASLCAVTYVLDEPTVGLHPRDTDRLLATLDGLRDQGNTVILVEHDPETIRRADHVIDLGPGAGAEGGRVLAVGSPARIAADPASVTGRWLSGVDALPERPPLRAPRAWITLREPRGNNLRTGDVRFPTGVWCGIAGVSGSGKSTLVLETLAPALQAKLGAEAFAAAHGGLSVGEKVDKVVVVDQAPIGRTPRSTPATYCGLLDPLRALFAQTPTARARGWGPGRFSFNASDGRCSACEGRGATLVEMHFLPDVWVPCEQCRGRRFDPETLEVRWQGRSIADVLAMRADEAVHLFANQRALHRALRALVDVGLGYLALGQPGNTLSGGEAQRVKLAAELGARAGHVVFVLDEPTTGLHLADVAKLVAVLHRLVDAGHTVITVEHHVSMLAQADWLLELGPDGGAGGGLLLAEGPPAAIVAAGTATGVALARESAARPAASGLPRPSGPSKRGRRRAG